jgi:hypothetical protein
MCNHVHNRSGATGDCVDYFARRPPVIFKLLRFQGAGKFQSVPRLRGRATEVQWFDFWKRKDFLGAFAKLRKANVSFVVPRLSFPSVRQHGTTRLGGF